MACRGTSRLRRMHGADPQVPAHPPEAVLDGFQIWLRATNSSFRHECAMFDTRFCARHIAGAILPRWPAGRLTPAHLAVPPRSPNVSLLPSPQPLGVSPCPLKCQRRSICWCPTLHQLLCMCIYHAYTYESLDRRRHAGATAGQARLCNIVTCSTVIRSTVHVDYVLSARRGLPRGSAPLVIWQRLRLRRRRQRGSSRCRSARPLCSMTLTRMTFMTPHRLAAASRRVGTWPRQTEFRRWSHRAARLSFHVIVNLPQP